MGKRRERRGNMQIDKCKYCHRKEGRCTCGKDDCFVNKGSKKLTAKT